MQGVNRTLLNPPVSSRKAFAEIDARKASLAVSELDAVNACTDIAKGLRTLVAYDHNDVLAIVIADAFQAYIRSRFGA